MQLIQTNSERDKTTLVVCIKCSRKAPLSQMWANLDGKPYRAYYCHGCKGFARDTD